MRFFTDIRIFISSNTNDNLNCLRTMMYLGGERVIKSHGNMEGVYINGAPQGITFHETDKLPDGMFIMVLMLYL